jgi:hypothetical protein
LTARDTFHNSCVAGEQAHVASSLANQITYQTSIDASKTVVGYNLQNGNFANFDSATRNANAALVANRAATESAKMAAWDAAREVLRASGDFGPL